MARSHQPVRRLQLRNNAGEPSNINLVAGLYVKSSSPTHLSPALTLNLDTICDCCILKQQCRSVPSTKTQKVLKGLDVMVQPSTDVNLLLWIFPLFSVRPNMILVAAV